MRDGQIQCPYHGWQFDGAGQCRGIPALPGFTPPAGHRACTHEAREAYGLVWVRLALPAAEDAFPERRDFITRFRALSTLRQLPPPSPAAG